MADDLKIKIKAILDLNAAEAAKQIDSQKSAIEGNLKGAINLPVDVDEKDASEKVKSAIQRIQTQHTIEFPMEIDTSGVEKSLASVLRQVENYQKKIEEAGGAIRKMQLTPFTHSEQMDTGEVINEKAYRAMITYQTAIGETIQKTIELTESGEILKDSVGSMAVDFEKQRNTMNSMADAIAQYSAKLEALKQQAAGVLTGTAEDNSLKAFFEGIDFNSVKTQADLDAMIAKFKQAQAVVQALNAAISNKKLAGTAIEQMNDELAKMPATLEKIKADFAGLTIPDDIAVKIASLEERVNRTLKEEMKPRKEVSHGEECLAG